MKTNTTLTLSLILNIALGILYMQKPPGKNEDTPDQSSELSNSSDTSPAGGDAKLNQTDPIAELSPIPDEQQFEFDWQVVESEDYLTYIDNLRKIGCPEETIQDIITADVEKLFKQRRKEYLNSLPPQEYWSASNVMGGGFSKEELDGLKAIDAEKNAALQDMLGSTFKPKSSNIATSLMSDPQAMIGRSIGFLPQEKQTAVFDAMMAMQERMMELASDSGGAVDGSIMAKAMATYDELLTQTLSPEEKFEVDLRLSNEARALKFQLQGFEPSEQEFREIYAIQQGLQDEFGIRQYEAYNGDPSNSQKWQELQSEMKTQINELLGDDRFAEYTRAQDYEYQNLQSITKNNGLSKDEAVQAYDIQKIARETFQQIMADSSMSQEAKMEAQKGIYQETSNALQQTLGDEVYQKYLNSPSIQWLNRLSGDQGNEIQGTTIISDNAIAQEYVAPVPVEAPPAE